MQTINHTYTNLCTHMHVHNHIQGTHPFTYIYVGNIVTSVPCQGWCWYNEKKRTTLCYNQFLSIEKHRYIYALSIKWCTSELQALRHICQDNNKMKLFHPTIGISLVSIEWSIIGSYVVTLYTSQPFMSEMYVELTI